MMTAKRVGDVVWLAGVPVLVSLAGCSPPSAPADVVPPATPADVESDQCRLDDLGVQRGDGAYVAGRNEVRVIWTNRSGRTCTMDGFGGVDLLDAQGRRVSAARSDEAPSTVTLTPGRSAHTTISYPAAGGTGVFSPSTILATPPNETHSAQLAWGGGGVPTFEGGGEEVEISPVRPDVS